MKFLRFIISLRFWLIMGTTVLVLLIATNFFNPALDREEIRAAFENLEHQPDFFALGDSLEGQIAGFHIGDSSKTPLLVVHGSPGSMSDWVPFMAQSGVLDSYRVIAIDRPGYGETTVQSGLNLAAQSAALRPVVDTYFKNNPGVVAGHSFGGALVLQLMSDYPKAFPKSLTVAGTVAPQDQEPRWYNYLMRYTPVAWIVNPLFVTSNKEMWTLADDLSRLYAEPKKLHGKLALVQGKRDILVDWPSAELAARHFSGEDSKVFLEEERNHFIIWTDYPLIMSALEWLQKDGSPAVE